jgi:hypothetical protein
MRCEDGAEKRRNNLSLALGSAEAESSGRGLSAFQPLVGALGEESRKRHWGS